MAVIVADFDEPVTGPDGLVCRARACGLSKTGRGWQGWIEFNPLDGSPTFRGPYEVADLSNQELKHWALHLTRPYLEQALARALGRLCPWSVWDDGSAAGRDSVQPTG